MTNLDPKNLIQLLAAEEASDAEISQLARLLEQDSSLASELRDELAFSEWIRQALRDRREQQSHALTEALSAQTISTAEWQQHTRDGEISSAGADSLARELSSDPEAAIALRRDLIEDEWIAHAISDAKSEQAFVDSLTTRMWAESSGDTFVSDLVTELDRIDGVADSTADNVIAFPTSRVRDSWWAKTSALGAAAAALAILAYVVTTQLNPQQATTALATLLKSTDDATWRGGLAPRADGSFDSGTYQLDSGAISLAMADGRSLAVEGPAVFEVNDDGLATLYEGIALAKASPKPSDDQIGIGLTSRNISFVDGAITVGIDARSSKSTGAIVFSGETALCLDNAGKCRDLYQHEAVRADHSRDKLVDVPYNPRPFSRAWELVSGVEANMGDIVIELPGADAGETKISNAGALRVFVENERFQPESPLEVDAMQPGLFASGSDDETQGEALVAANGNEMRSYLLQLSPGEWADSTDGEPMEASLTFDHPVVGVIYSSERLWESDDTVGASTHHLAGTEGRGLDAMGDQILLSEDRRTLNLRLLSGQTEIDQVRVLVAL